jgi:osmotically-inducible protein OsmY
MRMGELADRGMEESIRRFLAADSRVDIAEVEVSVEDRTVYLSGAVDGAAERQAILEDVRAAARIDDVVDQLVLRNFVQRTDDELKEAVRHALARDISVNAGLVSVDARAGEVALSGFVDSYAQKNSVEDVAWWTPGVTNVVNRLEVADESGIPADLKE